MLWGCGCSAEERGKCRLNLEQCFRLLQVALESMMGSDGACVGFRWQSKCVSFLSVCSEIPCLCPAGVKLGREQTGME